MKRLKRTTRTSTFHWDEIFLLIISFLLYWRCSHGWNKSNYLSMKYRIILWSVKVTRPFLSFIMDLHRVNHWNGIRSLKFSSCVEREGLNHKVEGKNNSGPKCRFSIKFQRRYLFRNVRKTLLGKTKEDEAGKGFSFVHPVHTTIHETCIYRIHRIAIMYDCLPLY